MPELPEVHTFDQYFRAAALHQRIQRVEVSDDHIIRNMDGAAFARRLAGRTFVDSLRRGKYLFARLDNGDDVLLHFGMTGDLQLYTDPAERPRFERLAFLFVNGERLAFEDARKFARILYLEDRDAYIAEKKLGPDALQLTEDGFLASLGQRQTTIKAFLLNQQHVAGIGNLYADEICYRARVHPASRVVALPQDKRREIYRHLHEVMHQAVAELPHYRDYPEAWFWHTWRFTGATSPDGQSTVEKATIGGRTTYFFPGYQRLYQ
ncbi:MAG: DNA-(apurinic or apyrimidinic site) lyase [Lewinella sp.]|nr:DNA-(apurinic or apyrimidinic site) lyase [Lewinella sp.]